MPSPVRTHVAHVCACGVLLATAAGWGYLAVIVDLFSRKVVGWSISDSLGTELADAALRQAIERRRPEGRRLLHHSDRGCQHTSEAYGQVVPSMGNVCGRLCSPVR